MERRFHAKLAKTFLGECMIQILVITGSAAELIASANYIIDTIKGKTQPNRVTWLIWAVAVFTTTAAELSDGVTWSVLPVFMKGFCPLLIFLASFLNKKAYWKLGILDYSCGFLAILALSLWIVTSNPKVAIIFALASDFLAGTPTIIKIWKYPETESKAIYIVGIFSALTAVIAIKSWSFVETTFPIYLVAMNLLFVAIIFRKKFTRDKV
jgi:hypothetical protein